MFHPILLMVLLLLSWLPMVGTIFPHSHCQSSTQSLSTSLPLMISPSMLSSAWNFTFLAIQRSKWRLYGNVVLSLWRGTLLYITYFWCSPYCVIDITLLRAQQGMCCLWQIFGLVIAGSPIWQWLHTGYKPWISRCNQTYRWDPDSLHSTRLEATILDSSSHILFSISSIEPVSPWKLATLPLTILKTTLWWWCT